MGKYYFIQEKLEWLFHYLLFYYFYYYFLWFSYNRIHIHFPFLFEIFLWISDEAKKFIELHWKNDCGKKYQQFRVYNHSNIKLALLAHYHYPTHIMACKLYLDHLSHCFTYNYQYFRDAQTPFPLNIWNTNRVRTDRL